MLQEGLKLKDSLLRFNLLRLWIYCKTHVLQSCLRLLLLQNNRICSLKGSLIRFKFLETLDVSNNQLRNLPKLASTLSRFHFLTFLNLKV